VSLPPDKPEGIPATFFSFLGRKRASSEASSEASRRWLVSSPPASLPRRSVGLVTRRVAKKKSPLPAGLSRQGDIWDWGGTAETSLHPDEPGGGGGGRLVPRSGFQTSLRRDKPAGGGKKSRPRVLSRAIREEVACEWTFQAKNHRAEMPFFIARCRVPAPLDIFSDGYRTLRARQRTGGLLSPRQDKKIILFSSEQNECSAHLRDEDLLRAEGWLASAGSGSWVAAYRCLSPVGLNQCGQSSQMLERLRVTASGGVESELKKSLSRGGMSGVVHGFGDAEGQ
jgi:hypothetical protein